MITNAPDRSRSATATAVMLGVALVPALLALLPLTLNGFQQVLGALGGTDAPEGASLGRGATMLLAASLPYLGGLLAIAYGRRGKLPRAKVWELCAATLFTTGLVACVVAMMYAF